MQSDLHHARSAGAPRRRWLCWPVLGWALLGAGCAVVDGPLASNHPPTGQRTLRAVHHWDVLAQDMATRIAVKTRDWPAGAHPIYVSAKDDTRFSQGFRKLLITRLVEQGVTVSTEPTAVHLVFEAQVVQHLQPASSVLHWVPLASGVSVARDGVHFHGARSFGPVDPSRSPGSAERDVSVATGSAFGASVAAATAPQIRKAPAAPEMSVEYPRLGTPSRSEVLVTASLESGGNYLAGTSDVYSLMHDDALLYLPAEPRWPMPAPATLKTWRVVSP